MSACRWNDERCASDEDNYECPQCHLETVREQRWAEAREGWRP